MDSLSQYSRYMIIGLLFGFILVYFFSSKFRSGWQLIKESVGIFKRHPILLLPLLVTWIIYAVVILYSIYFVNWNSFSAYSFLFIFFLIIFLLAFIIGSSCLVTLEMIQQIEAGQKVDIKSAFFDSIKRDLYKALPIVIVWTAVWLVLVLIETVLSKKSSKNDVREFNVENAARTLAGNDMNSGFTSLTFDLIQKGVRMVIFMILPALAWEDLGTIKTVKKGISIIKSRLIEFFSIFIFSDLAGSIVFLPVFIVFIVSDKMGVIFPNYVWFVVIIYTGFAWSFYLYLEQVSSALFYMWYLKWEKAANKAVADNQPVPTMQEIEKPSLLDNTFEFKS